MGWKHENSTAEMEGRNSTIKLKRSRFGSKRKFQWTPELKPRLNATQEARRHTLSAIEQPNVDQRRMLLKKSKNIGEGARRWQEAFEVLLADTRGIEVFRVFLRSEFSEENMVFFLACEELKRTRSFRVGPRARRIFKTFIEDNSPQEVNLDYETKKHIMESMRTPNRNIFDAAQRKVREMMAADAYPRFIRSDFYKSLIT